MWAGDGPGGKFTGKSCFYNPVRHPRWSSSVGVVSGLGGLTICVGKTLPRVVSKALPQMFG